MYNVPLTCLEVFLPFRGFAGFSTTVNSLVCLSLKPRNCFRCILLKSNEHRTEDALTLYKYPEGMEGIAFAIDPSHIVTLSSTHSLPNRSTKTVPRPSPPH